MAFVKPLNSSSIIDVGAVAFPVVDNAKCDFCDGCNAVCPTNAILVDEERWLLDRPACIGCTLCVDFCPAEALTMVGSPSRACTA